MKQNTEAETRDKKGKWRVLGKEEIERAKGEGWRPMLGGDNREYGKGGGKEGGDGERDENGGGSVSGNEGDLPGTPGWVPKLTPTRRGDELFLKVQ